MEENSHLIKSSTELRADSRMQLKGNWVTAVILCLVFSVLSGLVGVVPYVGGLIGLVLSGPLTLGLIICFMSLVRNQPFRFESLFDGFKNFTTAFLLQILVGIFAFLWSLLLIVPGIIAAYRYSMAFYILNDNPTMQAMDALNASKEMMAGFKWKLFCLHLSFIGWGLLCILTLGIGYLWLVPYINTANANFYQNLKDAAFNGGGNINVM